METTANAPTADELNAHIADGGVVQITTYLKSLLHRAPGSFRQGADGELYVRRGRGWDCLTFGAGSGLMVGIRCGRWQ